jgi:hypothetical protein
MLKPLGFRLPYITARNTPYIAGKATQTGVPLDGGVLRKNEVVWLKGICSRDMQVPAFVDHLGLVLLDSRLLVDLKRHMFESLNVEHAPDPA